MKNISKLKMTQYNKATPETKQLNTNKGGTCPCDCGGCLCPDVITVMDRINTPYGEAEAQHNGIESKMYNLNTYV